MERFRNIKKEEVEEMKAEVKETPYAIVSAEVGEEEIVIDVVSIAIPKWLWKLLYRAAEHKGMHVDEVISSVFADLTPLLLQSWQVPNIGTVQ